MTPEPGGLLDRAVAILDDAGVRCALIGAAALAVHGVSRSTLDIDLLVTEARVLTPDFWRALSTDTDTSVEVRRGDADDPLAGVVRIQAPAERMVDVVVGKAAWQAAILTRAERLPRSGRQIPTARAADLILLKLYAGGSQDRWDITQLLARPERPAIAASVEAALPDLPAPAAEVWRAILDQEQI